MAALALGCIFVIAGVSAADLRFNGTVGYSEQSNGISIGINASEVLNRTTSGVGGSARLELWASPTPYAGGSIQGHRLASHVFGVIAAGRSVTGLNTVTAFTPPPPGRWFTSLLVTEYIGSGTNDGYAIRDSTTFLRPMLVAPGGPGGRGIIVSDLRLTGSASFNRPTDSTVILSASELTNHSRVRSGSIRLELWASTLPYQSGPLTGHRLATFRLDSLDSGAAHRAISSPALPFTLPPTGSWRVVMAVTEYSENTATNDGYAPVTFLNLNDPFVTTAPPAIRDDHGNTVATATPASIPSSITGRIEVGGDIDYFRFTLPNPGRLTVFTTGNTDTYGELRDSQGVLLDSADDDSDLNFRISRSVPAGTYYVAVRHFSPSGTGNYSLNVESIVAGTPVPAPTVVGRLTNLSVRSNAGAGDRTLIVGCAISGSGSKTLLVRGVGPTLAAFGVTNALSDPVLEIVPSSGPRIINNDWGQSPNSAAISQTFSRLGAFSFPSGSRDSAVLATFPLGTCTMQISSTAPGVALLEVYDSDSNPMNTPARLTNLSARTQTSSGDGALIAGFVVTGGPRRILIRGVGASLSSFGVADALRDPVLQLYSGSTLLGLVDDWILSPDRAAIESAARAVGAFSLTSDLDAAMLTIVQPGSYTVHISGFMGATGIAMVEIYEAP